MNKRLEKEEGKIILPEIHEGMRKDLGSELMFEMGQGELPKGDAVEGGPHRGNSVILKADPP